MTAEAVDGDLRPSDPVEAQSRVEGSERPATPSRRRGRIPVPPMAEIADTLGLRFVEDES